MGCRAVGSRPRGILIFCITMIKVLTVMNHNRSLRCSRKDGVCKVLWMKSKRRAHYSQYQIPPQIFLQLRILVDLLSWRKKALWIRWRNSNATCIFVFRARKTSQHTTIIRNNTFHDRKSELCHHSKVRFVVRVNFNQMHLSNEIDREINGYERPCIL